MHAGATAQHIRGGTHAGCVIACCLLAAHMQRGRGAHVLAKCFFIDWGSCICAPAKLMIMDIYSPEQMCMHAQPQPSQRQLPFGLFRVGPLFSWPRPLRLGLRWPWDVYLPFPLPVQSPSESRKGRTMRRIDSLCCSTLKSRA